MSAVISIVELGSVSNAARHVNLTQPAVTQAVSKLEQKLGLALFDRQPDGMAPTEAARVIALRAATAVALIGSRRVSIAQVRAFAELSRAGSYAGAAAALALAEASLHRAVADLSVTLGHQLVERRGRGIMLTTRGETLARKFRLALAELIAADAELEAIKGRETGRIAVGAMPLSRAQILPRALALFHGAEPAAQVKIVEGSHAELIGPLRDGDVDLLIGALRGSAIGSDLVETPLFTDRPIVAGRAGHPLAGRVSVSLSELGSYPWIVPAFGTPIRTHWTTLFERAGRATPAVPIECGSVLIIKQMLAQSDCLTLLSPDQIAPELTYDVLVRIAEVTPPIERTIGYTTRAGWRPTALQARFLERLRSAAADRSGQSPQIPIGVRVN